MTIGEKIKYYRTKKGITQEGLASELFVTYQAVSKWERDESLPDVLMIAKIAKLLGTSCDALLTDNEVQINNEMSKIVLESKNLSLKERIEILEKALKKFPKSENIMLELSMAYSGCMSCSNWEEYREKLVAYAEYLVKNATDRQIKHSAIQILCYTYRDTKNYKRIKELAEQMPTLNQCREALFYHSMEGEDYKMGMHDFAVALIDTLDSILSVLLYPDKDKHEKAILTLRNLIK